MMRKSERESTMWQKYKTEEQEHMRHAFKVLYVRARVRAYINDVWYQCMHHRKYEYITTNVRCEHSYR